MIKKILTILFVITIWGTCVACDCDNTSKEKQNAYLPKENIIDDKQYFTGIDEVKFSDQLWVTPFYERAPQYDRNDQGSKAYFLKSVDYNGMRTYVFAFVGIPDTATKDNPVPGIVLVHGGGGTAFSDWVKMWNDRGYAAIAIDTEGKIPNANANLKLGGNSFESIKHHGPSNTGYNDEDKPVNQQYLYHAIASTIIANSFLSSFEQVDGSKIGLTGISWGGVIATNAAAYDDRFAFAAPVYGAVSMVGTDGIFGDLYQMHPRSAILWDDIEMLRNCRTPMLFVNWEDDPYFSVAATAKCANIAMNARMVLISELNHGHWEGANIQEIFNFADSVVLYR